MYPMITGTYFLFQLAVCVSLLLLYAQKISHLFFQGSHNTFLRSIIAKCVKAQKHAVYKFRAIPVCQNYVKLKFQVIFYRHIDFYLLIFGNFANYICKVQVNSNNLKVSFILVILLYYLILKPRTSLVMLTTGVLLIPTVQVSM